LEQRIISDAGSGTRTRTGFRPQRILSSTEICPLVSNPLQVMDFAVRPRSHYGCQFNAVAVKLAVSTQSMNARQS